MRDLIQKLWQSIVARDVDTKTPEVTPQVTPEVTPQVSKHAAWKLNTTMHYEKMVEDHLRTKAYLIAEKDGFRKDPAVYWEEARHDYLASETHCG
jgi:hypothetical protein